ncbi:sensor histidine kinase [Marinobacterium rhizophilum]|uniref:histidine kinase n=1 Tax=Marinobacterium rhizophilum TaxID=420402 RepID=A0ABY5HMH4_9GAMM|nr:ATP-binding protein [Marinobacterium rhizophilum]UTW12425.1 PAS domain S-box protein [Marinobacterium rhizophilum]
MHRPDKGALLAARPGGIHGGLTGRIRVISMTLILVVAAGVLLGWLVPQVGARLPDGWFLMKANTALAFLLCLANQLAAGSGRGKLGRAGACGCALLVLVLAGTALLGHARGQLLWLDTLLAADAAVDLPGRMSIQTALLFVIVSLTLLAESALHGRWRNAIADCLSVAMLAMIFIIIAGYSFRASQLFSQSSFTVTSLQTLACFVALGALVLMRRSRCGFFSLLVRQGIGSLLVRKALPFALLLPFILVGGAVYSIQAGWLPVPYAAALISSVTSIMLLLLVMLLAWRISDATEALAASEQHNRLLLDAVGEGIYGLDLAGRVTFPNPAACQILGYDAGELQGIHMRTLIQPGVQTSVRSETLDAPCRVEDEWFWRRDGTNYAVEYTRTPLRADGRVVGSVVVFNDVTERRKVERMKDEFISTVSHELRTPLTSIKGALGLMLSNKLGAVPAPAQQMLNIAYDNSHRLERLINDLLDINKIQLSSGTFQLDPVSVSSLLDNAVSSMQGYADKYEVHCRRQPDEPGDLWVLGVEGRLMQVMSNLLSNAIKYSPANGEVLIDSCVQNDRVRISVTDTGPGIAANFQHRIFEKFSQADSSDTRRKGGTGLGLAITKEIVEKHGGTLGCSSTPGEGACFYFELPLSAAAVPA